MTKWVELSGGSKSNPDDLWDIIMSEQFLANCSKELQTHIMDREPKKCKDMASIADRYVEMRKVTTINMVPVTVADQHKLSTRSKGHPHRGLSNNSRICSYCKRPGHSFEKCHQHQGQYRK